MSPGQEMVEKLWRNLRISVGSEKIRANFANKAPHEGRTERAISNFAWLSLLSADLPLTLVALSCVYLKIIGDLE